MAPHLAAVVAGAVVPGAPIRFSGATSWAPAATTVRDKSGTPLESASNTPGS